MTRVNCVPVSELTDRELGAEYRELPRVVGLVRRAIRRGETVEALAHLRYTMGEGHVRFFYPRLGYLEARHRELVAECRRRGRVVRFATLGLDGIPLAWQGHWKPDAEALAVNWERLMLRRAQQESRRLKGLSHRELKVNRHMRAF